MTVNFDFEFPYQRGVIDSRRHLLSLLAFLWRSFLAFFEMSLLSKEYSHVNLRVKYDTVLLGTSQNVEGEEQHGG